MRLGLSQLHHPHGPGRNHDIPDVSFAPGGGGILNNGAPDPTAVAELSQYAHQFGSTNLLASHRSDAQVNLNGNQLQLNGPLDSNQMNTYFGDTKFCG